MFSSLTANEDKNIGQDPENLRQSQLFLDSIVENIPNMIFVKDAKDLRFLRVNRAGERLLGVTHEELLNKNDYDLFPPEQADFFTHKDREVLAGRHTVDIPEEPISTPSGLRFLHTKKIPLLDASGNPAYLLGISEDITDAKKAEAQRLNLLHARAAQAEAEKSAARLRFLADASAALTESLNLNSMLDRFSRVIVRDFADWCVINLVNEQGDGVEAAVITHRHQDMIDKARAYMARFPVRLDAPEGAGAVIRTGQHVIYRHLPTPTVAQLILDPEMDLAAVEALRLKSMIIVPIKSYDAVLGAISFITTEEGRAYDEIDLSVALDLARRAASAIDNASLYKKSQEASRAKSAFLANMSHEIRTPLGAMLGFAELALDEEMKPAERNEYLGTVLRNGRELLRIVDEILDLSKVESERIHLEHGPFNPRQLVSEVGALLGMKAREKGLLLEIKVDEQVPPEVVTDRARLRQVLVNIIGNAVKFTDHGRVLVEVRARPGPDPLRTLLEFGVTDSGIGIDPDEQSKLFEPFMQADASMTRRFGGTGLGLFVSRKLAQLLGGDLVLARSTPGEGSLFVLTIQALQPQRHTGGPHRVPDAAPSPEACDSNVLVVDDSSDNRTLLSRLLAREGHRSETVGNGRVAVEKALSGSFDLILMDLQMPEMDGEQALAILRARGYSKPVIAVTAHAMKGDRERASEIGFDDYLTKPIDLEALRACLARLRPKQLPPRQARPGGAQVSAP